MPVSPRGGPDFTLVGFLVLAAFGTFLWKNAPLDSSRPGSEESGWYEKNKIQTPAMLWQDPFKAIHLNKRVQDVVQKFKPSEAVKTHDHYACNLYQLAQESRSPITERSRLRVIAAMVTMGSQAEIEERRRRRRYAVVSGLGEAGYVPVSADSIGFCLTKKQEKSQQMFEVPYEWYRRESNNPDHYADERVLLLWLDESRFVEPPLARFTDFFRQLNVPDEALNNNTTEKATSVPTVIAKENVDIFVLGPARSQTLRQLVQRAIEDNWTRAKVNERLDELQVNSLHFLSPFATIDDASLLTNAELDPSQLTNALKFFSPANCLNGGEVKNCISFFRTINTDATLANTLVQELATRIRTLKSNSKKPSNGDKPKPKKVRIALISEWDTTFGRALPKVISEELQQRNSASREIIVERFSYLRGIDGRGPSVKENGGKEQKSKAQSNSNDPFDFKRSEMRRPFGTGQFDYLRRLSADLKKRHNGYIEQDGRGYQAIGILGSDVFDKLLLLRALRGQFPGVVFFTTDLDAQLLHPSDYDWTRNVVIGSSFALNLNRELQGKIPPFRDSYQTSIYLATRLATDLGYPNCADGVNCSDQAKFLSQLPPQLFEVGRNGAVPLYLQEHDESSLQPSPNHTNYAALAYAVFFLFFVVVLAIHQLKPGSGVLIIGLLIAAFIATQLFIYVAEQSRFGEPLSFTDGVSTWMTTFIRYIALCLSLTFIVKFFLDLDMNSARLSREYFGFNRKIFRQPQPPKTLGQLYKAFLGAVKSVNGAKLSSQLWRQLVSLVDFREWKHYSSPAWILVSVALVVLGLGLSRYQRTLANGTSFADLMAEVIGAWILLIVVWLAVINYLLNIKSINRWRAHTAERVASRENGSDTRTKTKANLHAKSFWLQYCLLGRPRQRILRALSMWLFFSAFGAILFRLLPTPPSPCRGDGCYLEFLLIMATVFGMLFLTFLVLDAYRLCIYWIRGLNTQSIYWEIQKIPGSAEAPGSAEIPDIFKTCAVTWSKIHLIAERTHEISRLIYYPFAIIILLLISRSGYIDNWGLPQAIAIVVLLNISFIIASGIKLHSEAVKIRKECVQALQQQRVASTDSDKDKKLEILAEQIKAIRIGAFQPMFEQPIIRASLLLLGAIGLSVSEYMMLFR